MRNKNKQPRKRLSDNDPVPVVPPRHDEKPKEIGGPAGPDPTRYGDWERKGRCVDF